MKNLFFLFLLTFAIVSCQNNNDNGDVSTTEETMEVAAEEAMNFGETITAEDAIDIPAMLEALSTTDTAEIKLAGRVESVCQKKGCWMNLVDTNDSGGEVFVRFKDYGFFMPFDLAGSDVVIRGKAFKTVTSVDELRHYAEDEGLSEEEIAAITEPKEEYAFTADGVVITNRVKAE